MLCIWQAKAMIYLGNTLCFISRSDFVKSFSGFAEKSVCVCDEGKPVTEVIVTELENKSTAEKSIARNKNLSKTSVVSSGRYEQRSKIEQKGT